MLVHDRTRGIGMEPEYTFENSVLGGHVVHIPSISVYVPGTLTKSEALQIGGDIQKQVYHLVLDAVAQKEAAKGHQNHPVPWGKITPAPPLQAVPKYNDTPTGIQKKGDAQWSFHSPDDVPQYEPIVNIEAELGQYFDLDQIVESCKYCTAPGHSPDVSQKLSSFIAHLNDFHHLTLNEIADHIETLDVEIGEINDKCT